MKPELYDVTLDVDEGCDVAADHPDIVRHMMARIEELLPGFPQVIQKAWADTKAARTWKRGRGRVRSLAGEAVSFQRSAVSFQPSAVSFQLEPGFADR